MNDIRNENVVNAWKATGIVWGLYMVCHILLLNFVGLFIGIGLHILGFEKQFSESAMDTYSLPVAVGLGYFVLFFMFKQGTTKWHLIMVEKEDA